MVGGPVVSTTAAYLARLRAPVVIVLEEQHCDWAIMFIIDIYIVSVA